MSIDRNLNRLDEVSPAVCTVHTGGVISRYIV